jgi:hypothetical protein
MTDFERSLRALRVDWPPTPDIASRLRVERRSRRPLVVAIAVVVALAVAFAVPDSRGAILRFFHLGGVRVVRVDTLPPAEARPLAAGLGEPVSDARAAELLGTAFLPARHGPLYQQGGFVSTLLAVPEPALLSEFGSSGLIKKFSQGNVEYLTVAPGVPGLWIEGGHDVFFGGGSPRLAGNVLVWIWHGVTFRLEAPGLGRDAAIRVARDIIGTDSS